MMGGRVTVEEYAIPFDIFVSDRFFPFGDYDTTVPVAYRYQYDSLRQLGLHERYSIAFYAPPKYSNFMS